MHTKSAIYSIRQDFPRIRDQLERVVDITLALADMVDKLLKIKAGANPITTPESQENKNNNT
jgi:hypothetical protein